MIVLTMLDPAICYGKALLLAFVVTLLVWAAAWLVMRYL
jgi:hypothetical protein